MAINSILEEWTLFFGYYDVRSVLSSSATHLEHDKACITIVNLAAIIPLIGSLIGVFRIVVGVCNILDVNERYQHIDPVNGDANTSYYLDQERKSSYVLIARGGFELIGGGTLMPLIDLSVTGARWWSQRDFQLL